MNYNTLKFVAFQLFIFIILSNNSFGLDYRNKLDSLNTLLKNASNINDSIEIMTELGRLNYRNDFHQLAIENFYDALKLSEEINDKESKATLINNIAAIYYKNKDLENALTYFIQSYEIEKESGNKLGVSKSLNNIAIIYNEMNELEKSLEYYHQALEIRKELKDEVGIATIHNNMGLVFMKKENYNEAIRHYKLATEIYIKHNEHRSLANTFGNLARACLLEKEFSDAQYYIQKSFKQLEIEPSVFIEKDNYFVLYSINKEQGNYKEALSNYEKFEKIKDSLNSEEVLGEIQKLKLKYESDRKELENIQLKTESEKQEARIRFQNILVISIIVVLILVSVLAFLSYKNSMIRKKSIEQLEQQKALIEKKNIELHKLDQIKNKIFSVISHEVRNPLNSLLGTVELLTSGYLSTEEFFKLSTDLKQKVNQTTIFLNNLLIWAKSQMEGIKTKKEKFVLNDVINDMLEILKEQADMKGVEIERKFEGEFDVKADKNMIGIVVKNLISNAIKFTNKGEKVVINVLKNGKFAIINVSDQGIGISKDNQKKILGEETFSTMGTAQEVGTGLGLVLSKSFAEENGGKLWLESEEGKGSTFSFSVPLS